ncbi:hypothetical protein E2562_027116 [Oryza meyeriana var. granulata]|uniref:SNF2 N-terminal domain-containing protein n=1 Tax=Oryza meyeriana var. granulata TaxID=110450 RepID=A0A6G1EQ11_9ORYZ|nr:hypothetical protein E2562_027116 [Oryza meyeriana var. granulata]
MDRAHRLGQRKVVNVHRLIMRGTLEGKVMSLQRHRWSSQAVRAVIRVKTPKGKSGGKGLKSIVDELCDQSQYADEYDLNQFLAKLNGSTHIGA